MMSFRQFVMAREPVTFTVENYTVHIHVAASERNLLLEGQSRSFSLEGQYSAQLHKAHSPVGQDHIHVYARKGQLFALNQDGSAHDRSHRVRIPNKVAAAIAERFPTFTLPPNNFIEHAPDEVAAALRRQILLG